MFKFFKSGKTKEAHIGDEVNLEDCVKSKKIQFWTDAVDFIVRGGNPNVIDENGNTFLHRFPEWTGELVYHGVSLSNAGVKNNAGYIPLAMNARRPANSMLLEATPKEYLNVVWPNGTTIMTEYLKSCLSDVQGFDVLLCRGADLRTPNGDGQMPLDIVAKKSDYFDYVVCAFKNGHDISDMTVEHKKYRYSEKTVQVPLLFEMMKDAYSDERVESLLNILSKSDLTRCDNEGNTLLHTWATEFDETKDRDSELTEKLFYALATKISVNTQNNDGNTPLMSALKMGEYTSYYMCHGEPHDYTTTRQEFAKLLLDKMDEYGVNLANKSGQTALHYAAQEGLNNEVVALVRKGANVQAKDKDSKTPADIASNDLIKAYLQMVAESKPQKVVAQPTMQKMPNNQNTIA